jgi:hypothetical protein
MAQTRSDNLCSMAAPKICLLGKTKRNPGQAGLKKMKRNETHPIAQFKKSSDPSSYFAETRWLSALRVSRPCLSSKSFVTESLAQRGKFEG